MEHNASLKYFENVLGKMHIPITYIAGERKTAQIFDLGLRQCSGREQYYDMIMSTLLGKVMDRTVYKVVDEFCCNYFFLRIEHMGERKALLIGPYIKTVMDSEHIGELARDLGIPPRRIKPLEESFANVPFLTEDAFLFVMVNVLAETLWSGSSYEVVDINLEEYERSTPVFKDDAVQEQGDALVAMQLMEQRYYWENELMTMVARGQVNRAEKLLPEISGLSFKHRLADPVRNMKNYCIICNTLMRKAAQQGGVHPIYLDKVSSEFAAKIEMQRDTEAIGRLIREMIHSYCRLVKTTSMKDYSRHIRHAMLLIDTGLSDELSLAQIARTLGLNPSYLSALFKKETGQTVKEYIASKRVDYAAGLLRSSAMQIQDVATYCGIPDANYFSKVFKKHMGCTPAEYRARPDAQI